VEKIFLGLGTLLAGLAVVGGAFASHSGLAPGSLHIFETGIRFQMYHSFALILIGLLLGKPEIPQKGILIAGYTFLGGVILFSGSLYALSLGGISTLGIITPLGGLTLIIAWFTLSITIWLSTAK
jgi:uncharacterized membrane protein YgdD (TMEM256/DUF423 family)